MTASPLSYTKRVAFRLLLFGLVALSTLGLIEILLQAASLFAGARSVAFSDGTEEEIVLCLGDSNTYGVFYPQEQAYPAQLQAVLDRRAPGRYRALNLGLPGMNSSQVATRLEGWIDQYRPSAVVVSVGINNYWNLSDTEAQETSGESLLAKSRLYRLIRLLMTEATSVPADTGRPEIEWVLPDGGVTHNQTLDAETGELLVEHRGNWKDWNRGHLEVSEELWRDLSTMADLTAKRDVELVVMTYAAFPLQGRKLQFLKQQSVNETLRRWSQSRGATMVDLRQRFVELLPPGTPRSAFFASETESHANPVGYREVATLVADSIHPGRTVVFSFLENFEDAVVEREEVTFEQVALNRIRVDRDERSAMFQHPTSSIAFHNVSIGEGTLLEFAITLRAEAWTRAGDGVRFAVDVIDSEGENPEVYSRYIDPKHIADERRWIEASVDLSDFSGQDVSVIFRTSPGPEGNAYFDWSAWGEPRLVSEAGSAGR